MLLNKARRGELRYRLPIGFLYDEGGRVLPDPAVARWGSVGPGTLAAIEDRLRILLRL